MSVSLAYPIGRFARPEYIEDATLYRWIDQLIAFPAALEAATATLDDEALQRTYRPGGWTVSQVVHHCADSHMNAFLRFKFALTEDRPTIMPYDEAAWVLLPDSVHLPVAAPLQFLAALHLRWTTLLRHLKAADFERSYYHPADEAVVSLRAATGLYAWHGAHHLAHVRQALGLENTPWELQ